MRIQRQNVSNMLTLLAVCAATFVITTVAAHAQTFSQSVFDFGSINSCDTLRTRTQMLRLYMPGATASVNSVDVSAPFSTSLTSGTTLTDSVDVLLQFAPVAFLNYIDTLLVVLSPGNDTASIVLFGTSEDLSVSISMTCADFGVLSSGQTRTERIVVLNTGTQSASVQPLENVFMPFSVVSVTPPLPSVIAVGDSAVVMVQYEFTGSGRRDSGSIILRTIGPCPTTTTIAILGRTQSAATIQGVVLAMPASTVAHPGDDVVLPLTLLSPSVLDSANVSSMQIGISYDGSLFRPTRISDISGHGITGPVTETSPGRAVINLSFARPLTSPQPLAASQPLINLHGKTYLGRSTQSILRIDSASAKGLEITGQDGQLTVAGLCAANATQVSIGSAVTLKARFSSDANIVIEFTTLTDDPTHVSVVDQRGVERATVIDAHLRPASYSTIVTAQHFEPGLYFVVLRHGLLSRTSKLLVMP